MNVWTQTLPPLFATLCLAGVLVPAIANHQDWPITCELQPGTPKGCTAITFGSGSWPDYAWSEPAGQTNGVFSPALTNNNHTEYDCCITSTSRPNLFVDIDEGVLEGHGYALGKCGSGGF
jgi:hypothetical protein